MTINALRTTARFILEHAHDYEWSLQGMGMLRLYMPGNARLHVWDHRFKFPDVSMIHDHAQWGLKSTIIAGDLQNTRYRESARLDGPFAKPYNYATIRAGVGGGKISDDGVVYLSPQEREGYAAGDSYEQAPHEIHETAAAWGTVTLMQKQPTTTDNARVFWPKGGVWGTAEPRKATPEEIEAITRYSLETWFAD